MILNAVPIVTPQIAYFGGNRYTHKIDIKTLAIAKITYKTALNLCLFIALCTSIQKLQEKGIISKIRNGIA